MAKLSYIWFATWRRCATLDLSSNLIPRKVSSVTVTPISLKIRTRLSQQWTPVPSTARSRSGWIIFYAGCPVSWDSKLQSQVALLTTEAEYIFMSQSLRDVIPVMNLLQEMRERYFQVICTKPHVGKPTTEDQAHKCLLSSFLRTCEKGAYQDIPCWHERPDCWCTYKSSGTK